MLGCPALCIKVPSDPITFLIKNAFYRFLRRKLPFDLFYFNPFLQYQKSLYFRILNYEKNLKNASENFWKICCILSILSRILFLLQISDYHHLKQGNLFRNIIKYQGTEILKIDYEQSREIGDLRAVDKCVGSFSWPSHSTTTRALICIEKRNVDWSLKYRLIPALA